MKERGPFQWHSGNVTTTENGTVGRERAVRGFTSGLAIGAVDPAGSQDHHPVVSLATCMLLTSPSSSNIFPSIIPDGLPLNSLGITIMAKFLSCFPAQFIHFYQV